MSLPTHITINRGIVAHYKTGAAVALGQLPEDERNAVLAEIVRRYNDYMGLEDALRADALWAEQEAACLT